jgi:hypothetical protein
MVGKTGTGLGKPSLALKRPDMLLGELEEKSPLIKETKKGEAGRVAERVVVPMKPRKAGRREGPLL